MHSVSTMAVVKDGAPDKAPLRNLFTVPEAAEMLHWSPRSIMRYHAKQALKLIPWGRGWRMHRLEIERLERDGVGPEEV
jgi:hypothetical protein